MQTVNYVSIFRITLAQASKQKKKYKEQLELIWIIKINKLMIKKKIKEKNSEFEVIKANEFMSENLISIISQHTTSRLFAAFKAFNITFNEIDKEIEDNMNAEETLIQATISGK